MNRSGISLARTVLVLAPFVLLCGCHGEHPQSALHPAGPGADKIANLWWFLFWTCTLVFLATMALLVTGLFQKPVGDRAVSPLGQRFILFCGIIIPTIVVVAMLIYGLRSTVNLKDARGGLTVEVTAHQWWWDVRYPREKIVTANEIYIPVGEPVRIELKSVDVIHSFWVPNLSGKMDMLPDLKRTFWLRADAPGKYRGQCAEFCGVQHAWMAFWVVALPREEYDQWVADMQQPPPEPRTPEQIRGKKVFFADREAACVNCHAVGGVGGKGAHMGPDLTHIGSRLTIGAGTLPNNHGNLAGWILDPQAIRPGNKMPRIFLKSRELPDLVEYLKILK